MKFRELKELSEQELSRMLKSNREKLRHMRFKASANQLGKVREIRRVRKEVSQILTVFNAHKAKNN